MADAISAVQNSFDTFQISDAAKNRYLTNIRKLLDQEQIISGKQTSNTPKKIAEGNKEMNMLNTLCGTLVHKIHRKLKIKSLTLPAKTSTLAALKAFNTANNLGVRMNQGGPTNRTVAQIYADLEQAVDVRLKALKHS